MNPLVSVIIPSYNHAIFIEDCFQSLLEQTYDNIEVLVLDDCSTDNTFDIEILWEERLKRRFPRVEILRNDRNQGVCKTMNCLVGLSKGKYIFDIASDDSLVADGIEKLVSFYENHPEHLIVYSNVALVLEQEHYPFSGGAYDLTYHKIPPEGTGLLDQLFQGCFISAIGVMFLKKTFDDIGLFREDLMFEDWEYWLRVSTQGSIGYLDEVTVYYRVNSNSLSHLFEANDAGQKKARCYIESKFKIIEAYEQLVSNEECRINGLQNLCNYSIRCALNVEDAGLAEELLDYIRENRLKISYKYLTKYFLLKIGLLKIVMSIKQRLM